MGWCCPHRGHGLEQLMHAFGGERSTWGEPLQIWKNKQTKDVTHWWSVENLSKEQSFHTHLLVPPQRSHLLIRWPASKGWQALRQAEEQMVWEIGKHRLELAKPVRKAKCAGSAAWGVAVVVLCIAGFPKFISVRTLATFRASVGLLKAVKFSDMKIHGTCHKFFVYNVRKYVT